MDRPWRSGASGGQHAELVLRDAEHCLECAVVLNRRGRMLQIDEGDAGARLVKNCPETLFAFAEHRLLGAQLFDGAVALSLGLLAVVDVSVRPVSFDDDAPLVA